MPARRRQPAPTPTRTDHVLRSHTLVHYLARLRAGGVDPTALLARFGLTPALAEQPEVELPLATWYLAELAGRFGHLGLAAAAYNAGPRNVAAWLRQNGSLPFDEFVEAIPFRETRLYVKNVVADYLAYRALYPSSAPPMALDKALPSALPGAEF